MSEQGQLVPASATVSLREITAETLRSLLNLAVKEHQKQFVASNAVSIAEAYFCPQVWFRAISERIELRGFGSVQVTYQN